MRLKLRIATTDTLKQFKGSRKDLVCKKALRKEDVLQAVDGRLPANIASCIRGVGGVESGAGSHAESRPRVSQWRALGGHWQRTGSPTISRLDPVLFTLHGSRLVATVSKGISNGG